MGMYTGKGRGHLIRKATATERGTTLLGSGGGGPDYGPQITALQRSVTSLETQTELLKSQVPTAVYVKLTDGESSDEHFLSDFLTITFNAVSVQGDSGSTPSTKPGYTITLKNLYDDKHLNAILNLAEGTSTFRPSGSWIQWCYEDLAIDEEILLLEDHPALLNESLINLSIIDSTEKVMHNLEIMGTTLQGGNVVNILTTKAEPTLAFRKEN